MENTQKLKTTFFRKFIVSIFGIDKYDKISESTISSFIGYIILLSVLVTLILTPAITRTEVGAMEVFKNFTQSNLPDFKVVDDKFEVDSEESIIRTNKTDFDKMFDGTIILTNYANVEKEHKELLDKKGNLFVFSKEYLIIKQPKTAIVKYKYSSIAKQLGLPANFTKADTLKLLTDEKQNEILQKTLVFISIVILLTAVTVTIINVLAISIIAIITSKIMKIQIKYSKLFNISCMSITLATIVFTIITATMLLTRFNFIVPNLDLLYLILTYIYLVVALLLIRKREIGNQQELIIKQKIIIKKVEEQPEENRKDKEDKKDKKSDKDDKKENENNDNDNIVKDNT
ncbi:MAG: DUF1189 family protein [Clostridiales bacterium]|nr:DUF1189 family protein [Clostridiales bacterium]